jgi:hypothetical protein
MPWDDDFLAAHSSFNVLFLHKFLKYFIALYRVCKGD